MSGDGRNNQDREPGVWSSAPLTPSPGEAPVEAGVWTSATTVPDPAPPPRPVNPPPAMSPPPPSQPLPVAPSSWEVALNQAEASEPGAFSAPTAAPTAAPPAAPVATPDYDPTLSAKFAEEREMNRAMRMRKHERAEQKFEDQRRQMESRRHGRFGPDGQVLGRSSLGGHGETRSSSGFGPIVALVAILILILVALSQAGLL